MQVVDDPTNKSRRDLGANEAEYGIFGQPPPPDGSVWRSNASTSTTGGAHYANEYPVLTALLFAHQHKVSWRIISTQGSEVDC